MNADLPNIVFGCGYLGRRVAEAWKRQNRTVIAVTRFETRASEFAAAGLIPHVADVCDPASLANLPDADRVLFAVGFDRAAGRPQEEVFVGGLRNVVEQIGPRCWRFLYVSSTSVYGQSDGSWVDEQSETVPTQPGGKFCLAAESVIRSGLRDSTSLRFAGIYGPERLLARIADLQAGRELPGDPAAWLNLIHVDDGVSAVLAASDAILVPPIVLVSDHQPVTRGDYYAALSRLVGAPATKFDLAQERSRGSGGLNKRCSNRVLRETLGVSLRYPSYESGLPAAITAGHY